jgi:molecular chaperone DnaK (HSP70)
MVMNNHMLDQFVLDAIQIAPKRYPVIEVTLKMDANGIRNVHAIDKRSQVEKGIKAAIAKAVAHGNTTDTQNECAILTSLVHGLTLELENVGAFMTGEAIAVHKSELKQTERWIFQHPRARREVRREKRTGPQSKFALFLSSPKVFEDASFSISN